MSDRCNRETKGGPGAGRLRAPWWLGKVTKSQGGQTKAQYAGSARVAHADVSRYWESFHAARR